MKYMGSKSRIAKYIVPIIQSFIDKSGATEYYEPMVGGGNIIDKIKCSSRVGFDANKYLIALLSHVALDGSLADRYFGIDWQRGLTEYQDDSFPYPPKEVKKHTYEKTVTVTEWIPVKKENS